MLHDHQRVSVGNHLVSMTFQWNVGINSLFASDIFGKKTAFIQVSLFKIFICLQYKIFGAAFQKMLNEWYHSVNFQFSVGISFFQRTCNKKTCMLCFKEQIAHQCIKKSTSFWEIEFSNELFSTWHWSICVTIWYPFSLCDDGNVRITFLYAHCR